MTLHIEPAPSPRFFPLVARVVEGASAVVLGSLAACVQFVITFSFPFTTPDLSADSQGFLMKDLILFGAAAWTAADSLHGTESSRR